MYFFGPTYLRLQRARAYLYLGRHATAAELLTEGLAELPPAVHRSEWAAHYLADLGAAWRALGNAAETERIAAKVAEIAAETGSTRLARRAAALR